MTKLIFSIPLLFVSVLAQNFIDNGPSGLSGNCTAFGNLSDVRIIDPVSVGIRVGLQTNIIGVTDNTFEFTLDDIDDCCTGNGDFQFLKRFLQIQAIAEDTEEVGFDSIPGSEEEESMMYIVVCI